jgi:hypothetical protein
MSNVRSFMQPLCKAYVARCEALQLRTINQRDNDCIAYFQGARDALREAKSDYADYLTRFCTMILQVRGYSEIRELAKDDFWDKQEG